FSPQAWKIIRTRDTSSISARMYAITVLGFAFWLLFGIMRSEWPIMITNGVCLVLAGFILVMRILPGPQKDRVADLMNPSASSQRAPAGNSPGGGVAAADAERHGENL